MELFFACSIELLEIDLFFDIETVLMLNWIVEIEIFLHLTVCKQKLYFN